MAHRYEHLPKTDHGPNLVISMAYQGLNEIPFP